MSQKEETCSLHGEGKGKKRWLRKQRDQYLTDDYKKLEI